MASTTKDKIFFPGTNKPIAIFFSVVPVLTALVAAYSIYIYKLPLILICMLTVLIASCIMLAKAAIESLGDVTIEMSTHELTIRRLAGGTSYPWTEIESVKLIDPGATFGAHALEDQKTCAIGLVLRKPDRKETPPDDQPDVLVIARAGDDAAAVTKAYERISAMKRGGSAPQGKGKGGLAPAKGFRRPAAA